MSLGYAQKLSYREDLGGQVGARELLDSPSEAQDKIQQLAELVWNPGPAVVTIDAIACGSRLRCTTEQRADSVI